MKFHVAGLLKDTVGAFRRHDVSEDVGPIDKQIVATGKVEGTVKLTRTNAGILVDAKLCVPVKQECGRCLGEFQCPLKLFFSEQFLPVVDVTSGLPLPQPEDGAAFSIGEDHVVDLAEAVRQYALLALPIAPLCSPDCAGLCPQCGHNRNEGPCQCVSTQTDERLAVLAELLAEDSPDQATNSPLSFGKRRRSG